MQLIKDADSLLTTDFFKSRPDVWDLVETVLTDESLEELDEMTTDSDEFKAAIKWVDDEVRKIKGASYYEILGLLDLLDKHEEAIAYDCIVLGLRLRHVGTEDFTWGDLLAIVRQSPRFSALFRAMYPEEAEWGLVEQLLATLADYTAAANWQRGQGKQKDYPKPIPRPGVQAPEEKYGKGAMQMDDMKSWLGW